MKVGDWRIWAGLLLALACSGPKTVATGLDGRGGADARLSDVAPDEGNFAPRPDVPLPDVRQVEAGTHMEDLSNVPLPDVRQVEAGTYIEDLPIGPPGPGLCHPGPCEELVWDATLGLYAVVDTCISPDPCHVARCDPGSGACLLQGIECPHQACLVGECVPEQGGCAYTPLCDDGDPCTEVYCQPVVELCEWWTVPLCCESDSDCDDANPCSIDTCLEDGKCSRSGISELPDCCATVDDCTNGGPWDDGDDWTDDYCYNFQCMHVIPPLCNCASDGACESLLGEKLGPCEFTKCPDGCSCVKYWVDGCCETDADCEDGEDCTLDACIEGECKNNWVCLADGNPCTSDYCAPETGELFSSGVCE